MQGITNVSGVRRFAAELVHDIEMMEEGLEGMLEEGLEQAHRLSHSYSAALPLSQASSREDEGGAQNEMEKRYHQHHELHDLAPESTGPYGAAYIPVDVAKKISAGLLHVFSKAVSTGVTAVTDRVTAVTDRVQGVCSASQESLASCTGLTLALFTRLTSTTSTSVIPAPEDGRSSTTGSSGNGTDPVDLVLAITESEREGNAGLFSYPSWPVPGLISHSSQLEPKPKDQTAMRAREDMENTPQSCPLSASAINTQASTCGSSSGSVPTAHFSLSSSPPLLHSLRSPSPRSEDGIVRGESTYWRVKSPLISKIPAAHGGGLQLEVSPWMWRHQPVLNYHLSSDPESCRRLFEMGMVDAAEHYFELMKFFSPDEYLLLIKSSN